MDPRLQASFIPKSTGSVPSAPRSTEKTSINFFSLIAWALFIISVVAAAALFLLNLYEQNSIAAKEASVQAYEQKYDYNSYKDFQRLDDRLRTADTLLANHIALSSFFGILAASTAQNVSFTGFSYVAGATTTATITLDGAGANFNAVAFQDDTFQTVPVLSNVVFSGIHLDTKGDVDFTVTAGLDTTALTYVKNFATGGAAATSTASVPAAVNLSGTSTAASSSPTN